MKTNIQKFGFMTLLVTFGGIILMLTAKKNTMQTNPWLAPTWADTIRNPVIADIKTTEEGKKIYERNCVVCHGNKGKGDGIAAAGLSPKPADHSSEKIQKQSDGAIFWKITNGRPPMASYAKSLTPYTRWELVNYIRTLKAPDKTKNAIAKNN